MKLGFIYAGQGSQKVGMGQDFYEQFPEFKETMDNASEAVKDVTDFDVKDLCFNGPDEQLSLTRYTQPCMVAFAVGVTKLLKAKGLNPEYVCGLSLGEYSALYAADVLSEKDVLNLVAYRGMVMQEAVKDRQVKMSAVLMLDRQTILDCCKEVSDKLSAEGKDLTVQVANYNCPGQIVITGLTNEVQQASLALKEAGAKRVVELKVSGPFHSLLLKPAGEALLKEMESMSFSPLKVPYVANATAEIVEDSKKISTFFAKGIYSSVRWQQSIETMLENGVDTFVEIGPGKTLAGFMRKIAPKATVYNVSSFEDATALEKCLSKA